MVHGVDLFFALFNNLALFIALVAVYGYIIKLLDCSKWYTRQLCLGLVFGLFTIGCMYAKIPVFKGVLVDQRNAIIAISGFFGGPLSALISAILAGGYRIYLGGQGVLAGLVGVSLAATSGVILSRRFEPFGSLRKAAFSALASTLIILPGFLFVKDFETGFGLLKSMSLPYGFAIFLGIFIVGLLIHREENKIELSKCLSVSEEKFRTLAETSPLAIYMSASKDGRGIYMNSTFTDMFGYTMDEVPTVAHWWPLAYPEKSYRDYVEKEWFRLAEEAVQKSLRSVIMETDVRCKDGSTKRISWGFINIGEESWAYGLDITDRKKDEAELIKARAKAEAANEAKSQFLSNMSHEIRTPLNGILGMLELLDSSELSDDDKAYVAMSKEAGASLMTLINDVLDLARIESGKNDLCIEPFSLKKVFCFTNDFFWSSAVQKNLELKTSIAQTVPEFVAGDKNRIRQILMNLVGNAIKFTDKGKVSVLCDYDKNEQNLIIIVTDTGIGMTEKDQKSLFDSFTQGDSSYKKKFQGSGLGLAIVKNFVVLMNGSIEVSSVLGEGSVFTVKIPVSEENIHSKEENAPVPDKYGKLLNILVVEDNKTNLIMIQKTLEKMGHTVKAATDGVSAIEILREFDFDIIFMDIQMPNMGGVEATRLIREDTSGDFDSDIPIVALTAYALEKEKEVFLNNGMDEFVAKPVNKTEIIRALNAVMDK